MELRSVYKKLKQKSLSLNNNNKLIADFLLKNLNEVETLSLKIISKNTKQSNSTITRFCQELGFAGFLELRKILIDVKNNVVSVKHEIIVSKNLIKDLDTFYDQYFEILNIQKSSIKNLIKENVIDRCANYIVNARKIIIAGANINFNQAIDFKNKLNALGINCVLEQDQHLLKSFANIADETNLFITLSLSNTNSNVFSIGKLAKSNGAIWVNVGTLSKINTDLGADLNISFFSNESELWNIYSLRGEGLFQLLNIIFICTLNKITN